MTGGPGFEPGLAESESAVLPLDDPPFEIGDTGTRGDYVPDLEIALFTINVSSTEVACVLFAARPFSAQPHANHESQILLYAMDYATFHHIATTPA